MGEEGELWKFNGQFLLVDEMFSRSVVQIKKE
jgi:hypothetical protein